VNGRIIHWESLIAVLYPITWSAFCDFIFLFRIISNYNSALSTRLQQNRIFGANQLSNRNIMSDEKSHVDKCAVKGTSFAALVSDEVAAFLAAFAGLAGTDYWVGVNCKPFEREGGFVATFISCLFVSLVFNAITVGFDACDLKATVETANDEKSKQLTDVEKTEIANKIADTKAAIGLSCASVICSCIAIGCEIALIYYNQGTEGVQIIDDNGNQTCYFVEKDPQPRAYTVTLVVFTFLGTLFDGIVSTWLQ